MTIGPAASSADVAIGAPLQDLPRPAYIWGLDLVRFAAAVMVVLFHMSWKSSDPDIGFSAGWVGVEIFFVISGYVIMGSASGAKLATFVQKRFARLYPAAILCAFINFAVLVPFSDFASRNGLVVNAAPGAFIASVLLIKGPFLVGALWTLPIEIGFYALAAALIWRGGIEHPARIAAALILWSGLYLVPFCLSQYGYLPFAVRSLGYGLPNLSMLRHGCFFGVGILLWATSNRNVGVGPYAMLALGVVLCSVEIVARVTEVRALYVHAIDARLLTAAALTTFLLAILGIWSFSRFNGMLRPSATARSVMRTLGLVTYPLYLMHEGVGGVAFGLLLAEGYRQGPALLAGLTLSLIAARVVVALEPWLQPKLATVAHAIMALARIGARNARSTPPA